MGSMKKRFTTLFALALTLSSVLPMPQIANAATNNDKLKVSEVSITDEDNKVVSDANPVEANQALNISLDWQLAEDKVVTENEEQVITLPENLIFDTKSPVALENGMGTYQVADQKIKFNFKQNYQLAENGQINQATRQQYQGKIQLTAKTKASKAKVEPVIFNNQVTKQIYYIEEKGATDDEDGTNQKVVETKKSNLTKSLPKPVKAVNAHDIITGMQLWNEKGEISASNPLKDSTNATLKLQWELNDAWQDVKNGDQFTFQLPANFPIYNSLDDLPLNFKQLNGTTISLGKATVDTKGLVTITFNENVEGLKGRKGTVDVTSTLSYDKNEENIEINTGIKDQDENDIIIVVPAPQPSINKSGSYNPQTKKIEWEIEFNKEQYTLVNPKIIDTLKQDPNDTALQNFDQSSLSAEYYNPTTGLWEDYSSKVAESIHWNNGSRPAVDFKFSENPMNKWVKLKFTTSITDKDADMYQNKATLTGDNFKNVSTTASVNKEDFDGTKTMNSYDPITKEVSWTLKFTITEDGGSLYEQAYDKGTNATSKPDGARHYFIENSFTWKKDDVSLTPSPAMTIVQNKEHPDTKVKEPVAVSFDNLAKGTYEVTYKTKLFADLEMNQVFYNYMSYEDGEKIGGSYKPNHNTAGVVKKIIGYDYQDKTASWEIIVNEKFTTIKDLVLKDRYRSIDYAQYYSMELVESELEVYSKDNANSDWQLVPSSEYKVSRVTGEYNKVTQELGFDVTIPKNGGTTSKAYKVAFKTKFSVEYASTTNHNMVDAEYEWQGQTVHEYDESNKYIENNWANGSKKAGIYRKQGANVTYSEYPEGDDATQSTTTTEDTVYWNALLNYNQMTLPKDTMIYENIGEAQAYIDGSLIVREITPDKVTAGKVGTIGKQLVLGTDYAIVPNTENQRGFVIKLLKPTNKALGIYLKTQPNPKDEGNIRFQNDIKIVIEGQSDKKATATVEMSKPENWLSKTGNRGSDEEAHLLNWQLTLNKDGHTVKDATITDTIAYNLHNFVMDANTGKPVVKVYEAMKNKSGTWVKDPDKEITTFTTDVTTDFDNQEKTLTLSFDANTTIKTCVIIEYQTTLEKGLPNNSVKISNKATLSGNQQEIHTVTKEVEVKITTGSATSEGTKRDLKIIKKGDDGKYISATFDLHKVDDKGKKIEPAFIPGIEVSGAAGFTVPKVLDDTLILVERKGHDGYLFTDGEEFVVDMTKAQNEVLEFEVINKKATEIQAEKIWDDNNDKLGFRPVGEQLDFYLVKSTDGIRPGMHDDETDLTDAELAAIYASAKVKSSDKQLTVTNKGSNQVLHWKNLPKYENGKEISYWVVESTKDPHYSALYDNGNNTEGIHKVTNKFNPREDKFVISGMKTWNDGKNQDGKRPDSITVNLELGDQVEKSKVVTAEDNWEYSFEVNLSDYPKGTTQADFSISEEKVPGYQTSYQKYDITNSYTPEETTHSVEKIWKNIAENQGEQPDELKVELMADGQATGKTATLNDSNKWQHTWTKLAKNKSGKAIKYTVKEHADSSWINDFTTTEKTDGNKTTITNTYNEVLINIPVTKTWVGDKAKNRPADITVNLLADGVKQDDYKLIASENWTHTFKDLNKFKDGKEIKYTIEEVKVPTGYVATVDGFEITNTYTPEVTTHSVEKIWKNISENQGEQPDELKVELLANDERIGQGEYYTLTAAKDWTYTWKNLAKLDDDDKEIKYTVIEHADTKWADKFALGDPETVSGKTTITNTYKDVLIDIPVEKIWVGDQATNRPEEITVNLLADGKEIDSKQLSGDSDTWTITFEGLKKYNNGEEILYTIEEVTVPNYKSEVDGFTITNTYTTPEEPKKPGPATTTHSVQKIWTNIEANQGKRPDKVEVELFADGETTGQKVELNDANNWQHTWNNLAKDKDGQPIIYTVVENLANVSWKDQFNAPQYKQETGKTIITNTFKDVTIDPVITKHWVGDNEKVRPKEITVELYAGKDKVQEATFTGSGTTWSYKFTNLPKYKNGQEIVYTIKEVAVANYEASIEGFSITNTYTPVKRPGLPSTGGSTTTPVTKTPTRPSLPKTGDELLLWAPFAGFALMLIAALAYGFKRRKNNAAK